MSETIALDLDRIRSELPATGRSACLNTGTSGPLPSAALSAAVRLAAEEFATGRMTMSYVLSYRAVLAAARDRLASFVGADGDEMALTQNTTSGMNIATWGLDWKPGDRIVTTTLEHEGGLVPLYQLHRRRGVDVTFADVGDGHGDRALEALDAAISPGVKLVAVSHLTWSTGAILPLAEIVELAHERGAMVLVDGAQSVGAIPVDMHELGADFYAFSGQKWLCGPHGSGGLFVRRDRLDELRPTFTGYVGIDFGSYRPNDVTTLAPAAGAQRFEVASSYLPSVAALEASVAWLDEQGPIFDAIRSLAGYCLSRVRELPGVQVLTPDAPHHGGLVAFKLDGVDSAGCVDLLHERGVDIRHIPDNGALRISCGFFNAREEIDRAVELIDAFARGAAWA